MERKGIDWEKFRAETAANMLACYVGSPYCRTDKEYRPRQVRICVEYTDELIKQLKGE